MVNLTINFLDKTPKIEKDGKEKAPKNEVFLQEKTVNSMVVTGKCDNYGYVWIQFRPKYQG